MSQESNEIIATQSYLCGMLYAKLMLIRNDLRMSDLKNALSKVDDAINLMEEKAPNWNLNIVEP